MIRQLDNGICINGCYLNQRTVPGNAPRHARSFRRTASCEPNCFRVQRDAVSCRQVSDSVSDRNNLAGTIGDRYEWEIKTRVLAERYCEVEEIEAGSAHARQNLPMAGGRRIREFHPRQVVQRWPFERNCVHLTFSDGDNGSNSGRCTKS
jgi:hypothetical protein